MEELEYREWDGAESPMEKKEALMLRRTLENDMEFKGGVLKTEDGIPATLEQLNNARIKTPENQINAIQEYNKEQSD